MTNVSSKTLYEVSKKLGPGSISLTLSRICEYDVNSEPRYMITLNDREQAMCIRLECDDLVHLVGNTVMDQAFIMAGRFDWDEEDLKELEKMDDPEEEEE